MPLAPRHLVKKAYDGSCCSSVLASTTRDLSQSGNHEHWSVLLRSHEQWLTTAFNCFDVKTKSWSTCYNLKLPFRTRHVVSAWMRWKDAIQMSSKLSLPTSTNCVVDYLSVAGSSQLVGCLWCCSFWRSKDNLWRGNAAKPISPSSFRSPYSDMIWPWSLPSLSLTIWSVSKKLPGSKL